MYIVGQISFLSKILACRKKEDSTNMFWLFDPQVASVLDKVRGTVR